MNILRLAAAASAAALIAGAPAVAQDFPSGPVTIIVPSGPGSSGDLDSRAIANELSVLWGVPVVVENVAGASGYIGTQRVLNSEPDGHTILAQYSQVVLYKSTIPDLESDPLEELRPVTLAQYSPYAFVVSDSLPVETLADLIAYCESNPCDWGYANTTGELISKQLAEIAGHDTIVTIPYTGTAPLVTELIGGQLTMATAGTASLLPHVGEGRLKMIAIADENRFFSAPDVLTTYEQGIPVQARAWASFFVDKDVPEETFQTIYEGIIAVSDTASVRASVEANGGQWTFSTPDEFAEFIKFDDELLNGLRERFPPED